MITRTRQQHFNDLINHLINQIDDNEIILIDSTNDDLIVSASFFQNTDQNLIDIYDDVNKRRCLYLNDGLSTPI